jgi:hypothetical protein
MMDTGGVCNSCRGTCPSASPIYLQERISNGEDFDLLMGVR